MGGTGADGLDRAWADLAQGVMGTLISGFRLSDDDDPDPETAFLGAAAFRRDGAEVAR